MPSRSANQKYRLAAGAQILQEENGVVRVLHHDRVLEAFIDGFPWGRLLREVGEDPIDLHEMAQRLAETGASFETVHRMLNELAQHGILVEDTVAREALRFHRLSECIELRGDVSGSKLSGQEGPAPGSALETLLANRRSTREFAPVNLDAATVLALSRAAYGNVGGSKTVPSAGATYALKIYVGVRGAEDAQPSYQTLRRHLLARHVDYAAASAIFLFTGDLQKIGARYGERGYRYLLLEAGHAAQNLLLRATELGLGSVPVGALDEAGLRQALSLTPLELPLYAVVVGVPR